MTFIPILSAQVSRFDDRSFSSMIKISQYFVSVQSIFIQIIILRQITILFSREKNPGWNAKILVRIRVYVIFGRSWYI